MTGPDSNNPNSTLPPSADVPGWPEDEGADRTQVVTPPPVAQSNKPSAEEAKSDATIIRPISIPEPDDKPDDADFSPGAVAGEPEYDETIIRPIESPPIETEPDTEIAAVENAGPVAAVAAEAEPEPVTDHSDAEVPVPDAPLASEPAASDLTAPPEETAATAPDSIPAEAEQIEASDMEEMEPEPSAPPASDPPNPAPPPVTSTPAVARGNQPVPIGTIINNNYEIKQLLNAGGMGEVFRGENTHTGDAVAIKIVLQSLAHDEKIAALFKREARVLCQLSDQVIVRYYNFVHDADLDRFCLIMEFIDGIPLSDYVKKVRPLTETEALSLLRRLADGLGRAHKMEVVHRDLSPDNVMLRDGRVETPVLIDFGIAKSTTMSEHSLFGQLAGKFKYISPEQLGHFGGEIGPRTDIYGLALLIAAACLGEPIDMGSSIVEAVNARREIPDLSDIYPALRPLLAHMLEPDPAHRPARMSDVIRLIDHPEDLPEKYGGPRPMADHGTVPPTSTKAPKTLGPKRINVSAPPASGLRQPPTTMSGVSMVPGGAVTDHSASPFGGPQQTNAPMGQSMPPGGTFAPTSDGTMSPRRRRDRESSSAGSVVRAIVILGVLIGGGAFVADRQGLLRPLLAQVGLINADAGTDLPAVDPNAQAPAETPAAQVAANQTREGFLAAYDAGACSFATRIPSGPNTGMIEGYAQTAGAFAALPDAYEAKFGTKPSVLDRTIGPDQCAVLDLARTLQAGTGVPPVITLDSDQMSSGGSIVGRLADRRGRPIWLALVTTAGGVYNLTDRLTDQADGSATFSFGLNAEGGSADPTPQMIIAVATDKPLIAAAAAAPGASAASLLPLVQAEISGRPGAAGMGVSFFDLTP